MPPGSGEMANAWKQEDPKWRAQELAYDALETDDLEEALPVPVGVGQGAEVAVLRAEGLAVAREQPRVTGGSGGRFEALAAHVVAEYHARGRLEHGQLDVLALAGGQDIVRVLDTFGNALEGLRLTDVVLAEEGPELGVAHFRVNRHYATSWRGSLNTTLSSVVRTSSTVTS